MQTQLELHRRVASLAGLGIFERNFVTGVNYWNAVIREILEVEPNSLQTLEESINYYKRPELIRALVDDAIRTGLPEVAQMELITAMKNRKWVKVRIQAAWENGKCIGIYGTLEDVTEKVLLLGLLEEQEKRFAKAFDFAPIGMALVSLTGGWIKINANLSKLLGYSESEFLSHNFRDYTHPEDIDTDLGHLQELLEGRTESYSMEKRYFHKDGRVIWALLNVSLVRNEEDKPLYFVSQIKDISESKRHIETIRAQNSRLLSFAHIVSHNLRPHAGNMQMLTDMILNEEDTDERIKLTAMLHANSGNLIETLDNLNEIVKINDNALAEKTTVNLGAAAQRALDILSAAVMQSDAYIALSDPGNAWIDTVPAYIESILVNLISNALKYKHPDRRPHVSVNIECREGQVWLAVVDNGIGIDLARHGHKLFGMYNTFHRHPDARGLGLFLVKNQVESMGGRISAESKPGVGTTFTIEFEPPGPAPSHPRNSTSGPRMNS
jgi:PAS domain S-box-containing protein